MTEKVLTLKQPLEIRAKESGDVIDKIETVTMRRLKGGDFLAALDDMGAEMKPGTLMRTLAARSTRLTTKQIDDLDAEDLFVVLEAVGDFFPNGLPTGLMALN